MSTASVYDLKNDLKMMFVKRFIGHGFELPMILFTDECCEDRKLLLAMFREIRSETGVHLYDIADDDGTGAERANLPKLSFPSGTFGRCVWDFSDPSNIATAVTTLLRGCREQEKVLGLDCEWELSLGGTPPKPVSTVQLSLPDGTAYCFQLQRQLERGKIQTTADNFPKALKQLLEDPSIKKVGVKVNSDAARLARDYKVNVANTVDVATHASKCWVETSSRSLAGMVSSLLGKELPKDPTVRLSSWSSALNNEQIERLKDPIRSPAPTTLPPGTQVRLYSNNHASCVGVGDVQDDETAAATLQRWRPQSRGAGLQKRVVVKVSEALKPAAYAAHKGAPPSSAGVGRATMKDVCDGDGDRLVLWDVAHVRLAADWIAPPATPAPSAVPNASTAYDDDDDFFATQPPGRVVDSPDDVDLDEGEEDGDDWYDCGGGSSSRGCRLGAGHDSDSNVDMDDVSARDGMRMPKVRLDVFHALQRISRLVKKNHGAFKPFMARLRDAFFIVNSEDIKEASFVERSLEAQGMHPEEVAEFREKNWTFFLRNCRRLVPERERLLKRFNSVTSQFWDVIDARSGEILLRPKAMEAVNLLRKHIEADCISDPDGVALYYTTGKNAAGITTRRCVRGTNSTEGYHRHLRRLLSSYCASPALAHSILLEFNYRWNIRMAVKNRSLPKELGGFNDQFEIEIIQRDTASWYPENPLFSDWVSALD
ncbi:unnamed protein product, partial [Laminaria digitata]